MKRKREIPKEPEELLKRAAALTDVAEALLNEQRETCDPGMLVNKAEYGNSILTNFSSSHADARLVILPDLKTAEQFNSFGNKIIAQVNSMGTHTGDFNLHPLLSFISSPWEKRPNFHEKRDPANNPIRSPWRKDPPSGDQRIADKKANGGVDRTFQSYRDEVLGADEYGVLRDITFLPTPITLDTPSWKLALYTTLGARPDDIAHRISKTDTLLNASVVSHRQLRNRIKKKIDDWSKLYHGGFQWLEDRQKSRARKDTSGAQEPDGASEDNSGAQKQKSRASKGKGKAKKQKSRARKDNDEAQEQKSRASKGNGKAQDPKSSTSKDKSEEKEKEPGHEFAGAILAGWGNRRQAVSDLGYYFVSEPSPSLVSKLISCRIQPGMWTSSLVSCGNQTPQGPLCPYGRPERANRSRLCFSSGGRKSPSFLTSLTCRTWSRTTRERFYSRMNTSRTSRVCLE